MNRWIKLLALIVLTGSAILSAHMGNTALAVAFASLSCVDSVLGAFNGGHTKRKGDLLGPK